MYIFIGTENGQNKKENYNKDILYMEKHVEHAEKMNNHCKHLI